MCISLLHTSTRFISLSSLLSPLHSHDGSLQCVKLALIENKVPVAQMWHYTIRYTVPHRWSLDSVPWRHPAAATEPAKLECLPWVIQHDRTITIIISTCLCLPPSKTSPPNRHRLVLSLHVKGSRHLILTPGQRQCHKLININRTHYQH